MKQTHHIGYVQTPSVKNLSNVKNALVENGLVPLTTPNEMLPDAIEKGLENLKPENVRGNVKIGNVVGSIIETLDDVSVENPDEKYGFVTSSNKPVYSYILTTTQPYIYCKTENGVASTISCYNSKTNKYTDFEDTRYVSYKTEFYVNGNHVYKGGNTNSLSTYLTIDYFYKDEIGISTKVRINQTQLIAYIEDRTYILSVSSGSNNTGGVYCFEGPNYVELLSTTNKATFSTIGVIKDSIYILCRSSSLAEGGIYKIVGTEVEKIYEEQSININTGSYIIYEDEIFMNGASGLFRINNNNVVKLTTENFYLGTIVKSKNNNYYFGSTSTSSKSIYVLTNNNEFIKFEGSTGYGQLIVIEDTNCEYIHQAQGTQVIKFENNSFSIIYTMPSANYTMYKTKDNDIYMSRNQSLLHLKNGILTDLTTTDTTHIYSSFFEDTFGNIFVGYRTWFKITSNGVEQVYTSSASVSKFIYAENGDIFLINTTSSVVSIPQILLYRNGIFKEVYTAGGVIDDVFLKENNTLLFEKSDALYLIKETNGDFITYKVK